MAKLQLENIRKVFGDLEVIRGVDLEVQHGEFVVFVGPSGCGKSTMLRLITGLESVTEGRILIDDRDVTSERPSKRGVAMVFQSYALFPHLTVAENIGFGLRLAKTSKDEIRRRVDEVAQVLQVSDLLDRKPRQLSGGQRQRVAIGRSIIRNPKVFLFDEPLSNLDAALRVKMRLEITRLHNRLGSTMIYVTHDQTEAMTLADRIVVFNAGAIEQVGTPIDLYDLPANRFVAGFIGSPAMNFIEIMCENRNGETYLRMGTDELRIEGARGIRPGTVTLGIRPEHILLAARETADVVAKVEIVEKLGAESLIYLNIVGTNSPLTVRMPPTGSVKPGYKVNLRFDRERLHLFGSDGNALTGGH